jgi:hypothetical protein
LEPAKFEVLVGGILADFFDCDVKHVGRTGDGGIDLIVLDADPPLLVQVKRRTRSDATEGLEVVKHLFASLYTAGQRRGMVVTSAQRFTRGAESWARSPALRDNGYELDLVDVSRLLDITRATHSHERPGWLTVLDFWKKTSATPGREQGVPGSALKLTTQLRGEHLLVTDKDSPSSSYVFVRADRDCCSLVEHQQGAAGDVRPTDHTTPVRVSSITGFAFAELMASWPRSIIDALFAYWAGPDDELRIIVEP